LHGKIWSKVAGSDEELKVLESQMQVVSTHLIAGQHEVRIYSDSNPGDGFNPVDSELEDVYFLSLANKASN
jgi:ABC-2 type transport system ATP-binding protein